MYENLEFQVIRQGLVICPHPRGDYLIEEHPNERVDFVCHVLPNDRAPCYLSLILAAPEMLTTLEQIHRCLLEKDQGDPFLLARIQTVIENARGLGHGSAGLGRQVEYPCFLPVYDQE